MTIIQIKKLLFSSIIKAIQDAFPEVSKDDIEKLEIDSIFSIPEQSDFGFLSTNIALQLNSLLPKEKKDNPNKIANTLLKSIEKNVNGSIELDDFIKKIEVAGIGFVNFFATDYFYFTNLEIIEKDPSNWGKNNTKKDQTVLVEFTDPNPFKEFHIGHLMSNCIGESIARLHEFSGANVKRLCYQGDVGMHVAKTLWAWEEEIKIKRHAVLLKELQNSDLDYKVKKLGYWYSVGSKEYADGSEENKARIKEINKLVFSRESKEINEIYDLGKKWSLETFEKIYRKLGTKFDKYYFESETGKIGEEIVQKYLNTIFESSEGAVIFPGEKFGFHNRVFINSQKLPTYEAKELGLAFKKKDDFSIDKSIIITGNEVNDYFKVILAALKKITPQIYNKTTHMGHGMLRLPQGKMSSRTGNVVSGDKLIDMVASKIKENSNYPYNTALLDTLAVSAIKFSLLKQNIGKDVVFEANESISLSGATGVYLQYTHARLTSLINKSNFVFSNNVSQDHFSKEIKPILRELSFFPDVIRSASAANSPSTIANYLLSLAQLYNSYYSENKILGTDNELEGTLLSSAVRHTIAAGLKALGIEPVKAM